MPRVTRPAAGRSAPERGERSPRTVNDRPSRWRLLLRRQRWALRPALLLLALTTGTVLVAALLRGGPAPRPGASASAVLASGSVAPWRERLGALVPMRVQQLDIEGRANTPEAALRAAIGVVPGQPILAFSVADARQRVESLPWVEHATVERRLPGRIVVQIAERRPFAVWQNQGKFMLIDRQGQVVADQQVAQFRDLPLVVGPGAPEQAAALLDALAALPALQSRLTAAVRVGERRWNLVLTNGMQILLPEGAAPAALARLMELQTTHALLDRPLLVVDLRLPDRLVLRPRGEVPAGAATPAGVSPARRPT